MPVGGYLLIPPTITNLWSTYRQYNPDSLEAGGILLGRRRHPHIELTMITHPHNGDIRRRHSFDRFSSKHGDIAVSTWSDSHRYIDYLGEWHTHPEIMPYPSSIDISEMSQIAAFRTDAMLSVIIGINQLWIGMFQGDAYMELRQLNQYSDDPV